jgi:hypothetical protein
LQAPHWPLGLLAVTSVPAKTAHKNQRTHARFIPTQIRAGAKRSPMGPDGSYVAATLNVDGGHWHGLGGFQACESGPHRWCVLHLCLFGAPILVLACRELPRAFGNKPHPCPRNGGGRPQALDRNAVRAIATAVTLRNAALRSGVSAEADEASNR